MANGLYTIDIGSDPVVEEPIPSQTLDIMLLGYQQAGTRYLLDATYLGTGQTKMAFQIDAHHHFDTKGKLYHITEVECANMFNQAAYVAMAHLLATERIQRLGVISPDEFVKLELEGSPIRCSQYEYPREVKLATGRRINAQLDINSLNLKDQESQRSLKAMMRFSLEEDSMYGTRDMRFFFAAKE